MRPNERLNISGGFLVGSNNYLPPERDEIEISLFGPGYGESVLLHIGSNNWIIVDSCIDPTSKLPIPLSYLHKIKVNPEEAVKQIMATHWHDDHIRGLSTILRECGSAEFICSVAQTTKEFLTLMSAYGVRPVMDRIGINEFFEIYEILQGRTTLNIPKHAIADRILWHYDPENGETSKSCTIWALSPSDASFQLAQLGIATLIPPIRETKKRIRILRPNHSAVVLLVIIGDIRILLGADLEESGETNAGWGAIVNSGNRPQDKAFIFKIPHHGSISAHNQEVWSSMLEKNPISALTPFTTGDVFLPTKEDVIRICNNTDKAFSSGLPRYQKNKSRTKVVEKQLKEMGVKIRTVQGQPGHVRIRGRHVEGKIDWEIKLLEGALDLCDMYN